MSEYSQVQLYMECPIERFEDIRDRFIKCLFEYGFDQSYLQTHFGKINWELADNFFMYTGCDAERITIIKDNISIDIHPIVMGLTPQVFPTLKENWVELALYLKTEDIIDDYKTNHLKTIWQPLIWDIMCLFEKHFSKEAIYFTDEVTDGMPWEAVIENKSEFQYWLFDAAIIPDHLKTHYDHPLADEFYKKDGNKKMLFARKVVWDQPPWHK